MRYSFQQAPAVVDSIDVAALAETEDGEPGWNLPRIHHLLFGPMSSTYTPRLTDRDHAAVGTLLTYRGTDLDLDDETTTVLATARATGRALERTSGWYMETGVVMLAGEVAARSIHAMVADQHGPVGFEALADVLADLWPLPGDPVPAPVSGRPGPNLSRMLAGPAGQRLALWQRQALGALTRAYSSGRDMRIRAVGRCVVHATPHLLRDPDVAVRTRRGILAARSPWGPVAATAAGRRDELQWELPA